MKGILTVRQVKGLEQSLKKVKVSFLAFFLSLISKENIWQYRASSKAWPLQKKICFGKRSGCCNRVHVVFRSLLILHQMPLSPGLKCNTEQCYTGHWTGRKSIWRPRERKCKRCTLACLWVASSTVVPSAILRGTEEMLKETVPRQVLRTSPAMKSHRLHAGAFQLLCAALLRQSPAAEDTRGLWRGAAMAVTKTVGAIPCCRCSPLCSLPVS